MTDRRTFRAALRAVTPPVLLPIARQLFGRVSREWSYLGPRWPAAPGTGWGDGSVDDGAMRQYLDLKKRLDTSAWLVEADSRPATPAEIEHSLTWISFAYVLALAAWGKTHLSILDWGGGIGTYRNLARALGPSVDLEYHVRELPGVVRAAAGLAPDVTFHDNDADALARQYNLIVASSSLHYARDWSATLGSLANACQEYLYVARQPVVWHVPSFVVGQRPPGYADPYPGWFLNQSHLLSAAADCGLRLERAFVLAEAPFVPGAPEQSEYRAYLFRRSA